MQSYLQRLLLELCRINTAPQPNAAKRIAAENRCFQILQKELAALPFPGAKWERHPIDSAIKSHPNYTQSCFAKMPAGSREQDYAGRSNLIYLVPGTCAKSGGVAVAFNAHIDVVAPYFPPSARDGVIYGRGACDDKGPLVCFVAALRLLSEVMGHLGLEWNRDVVGMFVIEEETGGNGSLSLAIDRGLKRHYDSVVVGEPTSLKIHPANRGAVWYRAELKPPAGVSPLELFAFVNEQLEVEGAAIRAESRHALFPQRPVQTCHGIIGPFGRHPSRICGEVKFQIQFARRPGRQTEALVRNCLDSGLAGYVGTYGDKTKVTDAATGRPMVTRHYDLRRRGKSFEITVHGATGHMGAIRERDGAITKTAHLVRSLVFSRHKLVTLGGPLKLELAEKSRGSLLVLEGGQGFLPTHGIDEVKDRLRRAATRGAKNYFNRIERREPGAQCVTITFDKLHNAAFDGDPDSLTMRQAISAATACGISHGEPIHGWTASCDARLFATEYPGLPVLTFGPGNLALAHSDQEQIALADMMKAVEFLALFLLRQTGTIK